MFQPGEYVVYGDNGLCLIEQIGVPDFELFERGKTYYFLRAQEDGSRIYVPTDTRMPLRAPIGPSEAEQLLAGLKALPVSLPASRDRKTVLQHYQQLMRPHTCQALAQTVKSIHARSLPGRMSNAEETLFKRAEKQLCSELAGALHISLDDAHARLASALES